MNHAAIESVDVDLERRVRRLARNVVDRGHYLPGGYSWPRMCDMLQAAKVDGSFEALVEWKAPRILGGLVAAYLNLLPYQLRDPVEHGTLWDLAAEIEALGLEAADWMFDPELNAESALSPPLTDAERAAIVEDALGDLEILLKAAATYDLDVDALADSLRAGSTEDFYMGFACMLKITLQVAEQASRGVEPSPEVVEKLDKARALQR